jgi:hypothetical protein
MKHTKEQLKDIVITAIEGGVNYWAQVSQYDPDNGSATLHEMDDDNPAAVIKVHKVSLSTVRKGLKLALESEHEHIRVISVSDILDADDADIIIQLGIFGEIIYG